jgi:hypothetical protein
MTSDARERRLQALLLDHQAAVREFVNGALALPEAAWLVPRAEGKWTPAQETRHLVLTFDAFTRDLSGERRMGLRGTAWRRLLWRAVGLSQILWRRRIPVAVRAPREARPEWEETPREVLLAELRERAARFDALFAESWRHDPQRRVRHPFFGGLSLDHAIRLSSVHTRHHAAFLMRSTSS